ncbi:MAG: cadherin-like domain-containing protein, partial [Pseudomonadota bacterium]
VKADSDEVVGEIVNGLLDPSLLDGEDFNIAVEYLAGGEESITIEFGDGSMRTESGEPYAVFGDVRGDFFSEPVPAEGFDLTLRAFTQNGGNGALLEEETISIVLAGASPPPVAVDDSATTAEDSAVLIQVLDNDSDPDGDPFGLASVDDPANGTAVIQGDAILYTPGADFFGTDEFVYRLSPGGAEATVRVNVTPEPDAPEAGDDSASTGFEQAVLIDVLANDEDADLDPIVISDIGAPSNGTAELSGTTILYTPNAGFTGTDSFSYEITAGGETASATTTVNVGSSDPSDFRLLLVKADSDEVVGEIVNGLLDPSLLDGEDFNIAVEYLAGGEESLRLQLGDGPIQTESAQPYALFGDSRGDFFGEPAPTGPFDLTIQAFSQNGGNGTLLDEETLSILLPDDFLF